MEQQLTAATLTNGIEIRELPSDPARTNSRLYSIANIANHDPVLLEYSSSHNVGIVPLPLNAEALLHITSSTPNRLADAPIFNFATSPEISLAVPPFIANSILSNSAPSSNLVTLPRPHSHYTHAPHSSTTPAFSSSTSTLTPPTAITPLGLHSHHPPPPLSESSASSLLPLQDSPPPHTSTLSIEPESQFQPSSQIAPPVSTLSLPSISPIAPANSVVSSPKILPSNSPLTTYTPTAHVVNKHSVQKNVEKINNSNQSSPAFSAFTGVYSRQDNGPLLTLPSSNATRKEKEGPKKKSSLLREKIKACTAQIEAWSEGEAERPLINNNMLDNMWAAIISPFPDESGHPVLSTRDPSNITDSTTVVLRHCHCCSRDMEETIRPSIGCSAPLISEPFDDLRARLDDADFAPDRSLLFWKNARERLE